MFGLVSRFKKSLQKTQSSLTQRVRSIFAKHTVDETMLEELEEVLIQADVGVEITMETIEKIRQKVEESREATYDVYSFLRQEMTNYLPEEATENKAFSVLLVLGVNGSGKTTSIAKLAKKYQEEGRSVIVAAADTFRAAAVEQLRTWCKRLNIPLVEKEEGADPSAVIYEALEVMKSQKRDLLIIDTAGRLHTKKHLMDELSKMKRTISKHVAEDAIRTRLVLDATNGNNGLMQARHFSKDIGIDDLLLAKLDSSAKGGFIFSIAKELNLPVRYVGVGEKPEDLLPFSRQDFIEALFAE